MKRRQPKYAAIEAGRRGEDIYERRIRSQVEPAQHGRVVAIDIETEEYAVEDTALAATEKLRRRLPHAEVWCVRVGFPTLRRFGLLTGRPAMS